MGARQGDPPCGEVPCWRVCASQPLRTMRWHGNEQLRSGRRSVHLANAGSQRGRGCAHWALSVYVCSFCSACSMHSMAMRGANGRHPMSDAHPSSSIVPPLLLEHSLGATTKLGSDDDAKERLCALHSIQIVTLCASWSWLSFSYSSDQCECWCLTQHAPSISQSRCGPWCTVPQNTNGHTELEFRRLIPIRRFPELVSTPPIDGKPRHFSSQCFTESLSVLQDNRPEF